MAMELHLAAEQKSSQIGHSLLGSIPPAEC